MPSCNYCGQEVDCEPERIGQERVYVCGLGSCSLNFEREKRDYERAVRDEARREAEEDGGLIVLQQLPGEMPDPAEPRGMTRSLWEIAR